MLRDLSLGVAEGEFVAILGFSGSGKTTIMNMIAGLTLPDRGSVTFRGKPVKGPGPERGMVFQSYSLMPWLTVRGNVLLAIEAMFPKLGKAAKVAKADHCFGMVGLSHAVHRRPAELSGGLRQRVAVARALALDPDLPLLDEPLSALDALTRANLADEILENWEADKKAVVLITNDVDEAIVMADRIIPLNPDGTLGDPVTVSLPRPRDRTAMNHGAGFKALRGRITGYLMDMGIEGAVAETRVLPDVTPIHGVPSAAAAAQEGMLEKRFLDFSQLQKIYPTPKGPSCVVEYFDIKVNRGEFNSLIGQSGCGKSTVLTMAAGLNPISKGAIKLDGRHVEGADPERAVVFQSPNLFPCGPAYPGHRDPVQAAD